MFTNKEFKYRGCICRIEFEREPDCVKAYHSATLPSGTVVNLEVSPYDVSELSVRKALDVYFKRHSLLWNKK